jgi:hypothetical protein
MLVILVLVLWWCALSVALALLIGAFLREGGRELGTGAPLRRSQAMDDEMREAHDRTNPERRSRGELAG